MAREFTAVRVDKATVEKLKAISERTGISMARIASDGIEKEIERLKEIFKDK